MKVWYCIWFCMAKPFCFGESKGSYTMFVLCTSEYNLWGSIVVVIRGEYLQFSPKRDHLA